MARIKISKWHKQNGLFVKEIIINNTTLTINDVIDLVNTDPDYLLVSEEKKLKYDNKRNGESSADYIARISGVQPRKENESHYEKPIDMTLPDGTLVKGVLRISDHGVDLGTFAKNNPGYDFGVSITTNEQNRLYGDTRADRKIHIIEYVIPSKNVNKQNYLMVIADNIVNIQNNGWSSDTNFPQGVVSIDKTNDRLLESKIEKIVRKVLNEMNYGNTDNR